MEKEWGKQVHNIEIPNEWGTLGTYQLENRKKNCCGTFFEGRKNTTIKTKLHKGQCLVSYRI